ncbi:uncharacterized protein SRS1_13418 [Sporisorium reilianum f. sp. reilianum]|uniref:Uncharacterized protein n=1 Tax=Sporisorium reilianum f. sp. reilianum TaxID=72559 RepID=A0A2N8UD34_9BASI|nr:uncharacterized protein SRS1_13418 [Sporisorium reilianum f. sp. reilianum]
MSKSDLLVAVVAVWLVALLPCALAGMSDTDREYWNLATKKYINRDGSHEIPFRSYRTSLDSYRHLDDLESKALAHASRIGVLPIRKDERQPMTREEASRHPSTEVDTPVEEPMSKLSDNLHTRLHLSDASDSAIVLTGTDLGRSSTAAETSAREPIYFSSIIAPGNDLHEEMGLNPKAKAFAFWKHQSGASQLLHVDTLELAGGSWKLQALDEVLRHH